MKRDICDLVFRCDASVGRIVRGVWDHWVEEGGSSLIGLEYVEIAFVRGRTIEAIDVAFPCSTAGMGIFSRRPCISILLFSMVGQEIKCIGRTEAMTLDDVIWRHNGQAHTVKVPIKGMRILNTGVMTVSERERLVVGDDDDVSDKLDVSEDPTLFVFATALGRLKQWIGLNVDPSCPSELSDLREAAQGLPAQWTKLRQSAITRTLIAAMIAHPSVAFDTLARAYGVIAATLFDRDFFMGVRLAIDLVKQKGKGPMHIVNLGQVVEVYTRIDIQNSKVPVLASTSRSYISLIQTSGAEVPLMLNALLQAEVMRSAHRNGWDDMATIFCVQGVSAAAYRGASYCVGCHRNGCPNAMPMVYMGRSYLTMSDIVALLPLSAADDIRTMVGGSIMVAPEIAAVGERCLMGDNEQQITSPPTKVARGYPWKAIDGDYKKPTTFAPVWSIQDAIPKFAMLFGSSAEFALCTWTPDIIKTIGVLMETPSVDTTLPSPPPPPSSSASPSHPQGMVVPIPGYDDIRSAKWDAYTLLMECAPPCIQRMTRDAYTVAHPKDAQRMVLVGFLSHITGLLDSEQTFLRVWIKFFRNITKLDLKRMFFTMQPGRPTVEHLDAFAKSEYGHSIYANAAKVDPQRRPGCSYACETKICPFATMATTRSLSPADLSVLCDIEDTWMDTNKIARPGNTTQRISRLMITHLQTMASMGMVARSKSLCRVFMGALVEKTPSIHQYIQVASGRPIDVYTSVYNILHPQTTPILS